MKLALVLLLLAECAPIFAHDPITTKVTWDREVFRLILLKCASCHREGSTAFSLMTYEQARPWATSIKDETLERRMPPFGAVKGFGSLANDQALSQEQLQLLSDWVEGGAPEGDPALLPKTSVLDVPKEFGNRSYSRRLVKGIQTLDESQTLAGIEPADLKPGSSLRVVAQEPDGTVIPLIWLYQYNPKFKRAYYFRAPLSVPAGTKLICSSDAGSVAIFTIRSNQRSEANDGSKP